MSSTHYKEGSQDKGDPTIVQQSNQHYAIQFSQATANLLTTLHIPGMVLGLAIEFARQLF